MALTTAYLFIDQLIIDLFKPESRRLEMEIERLDKSNREMKQLERWGFMHAGTVYVPKSSPYRQQGTSYPTLHFALCKQANAFIKDVQTVEYDKQMIKQICHLLVHNCENRQDVRDALPEPLVELASGWFSGYSRTREEAYTIRHDERAMRQYTQLLDKIDFYLATRMIY